MMRINKSAVRDYTLAVLRQNRPHLAEKKTRLSAEFFKRADAALAAWIVNEVNGMTSTGKTIR